jgi:hypothetical protein
MPGVSIQEWENDFGHPPTRLVPKVIFFKKKSSQVKSPKSQSHDFVQTTFRVFGAFVSYRKTP